MPNSPESLANKVIDRMGSQVDKLVDNINSVNGKLSAIDVHMQNFTLALTNANTRFERLEEEQLLCKDKVTQVYDRMFSPGGVNDQIKESADARHEYVGQGPNDTNSLRHQIKAALKDINENKIRMETVKKLLRWQWAIITALGAAAVFLIREYFVLRGM